MACPNQLDIFKSATEQLGPVLYKRASFQTPIRNMVKQTAYPGYATDGNTVFTIEASGPPSEDEVWTRIYSVQDKGQNADPCDTSLQSTYTGYRKWVYVPEKYEMSGVLLCRSDLGLNWNTAAFWNSYFTQMERRGAKSQTHRLVNALMHFVPKAAATQGSDFAWVEWDKGVIPAGGASTPTPSLSGLSTPAQVTYCELDQNMLDAAVEEMIYAGATQPDDDGFITMGDDGPVWPVLLGLDIKRRLLVQNSEQRSDIRYGWMGNENMSPLLKRVGAAQVINSSRYVTNLFPPRWAWSQAQGWVRIPAKLMIDSSGQVNGDAADYRNAYVSASQRPTKGRAEITNPIYKLTSTSFSQAGNPLGAPYEGAIIPSPWVMEEEIIRPMDQLTNTSWKPTNYAGQWVFKTGKDALNSADCGTNADPFDDYGRHYGRYWHALKPIHPEYGRLIIFKRCADEWECNNCS